MKTCPKFDRLRAKYLQETAYLLNHAARHQGSHTARASTDLARSSKQRMARGLSGHVARCLECG
ncbi:hypothetical protein [Streptomyces sp. CC208A]|uniref:hypothetical protein n=1 Tax=Streptomyces sp. CC208A TaxID=3044573 RepID=UPI0024A80BDE|nr:hypothetical protein [Streptomyces sp. CC208A]